MINTMPYVRRPRSNALKIVNPDTMEEINAASAAAAAIKPSASTATSEGSPAPSEVSLFFKKFFLKVSKSLNEFMRSSFLSK